MMKKLLTALIVMSAMPLMAQSDNLSLVDLQKAAEQIRAKEKELVTKEQDLNARQERLNAMQDDLVSREAELQKIRKEISTLIERLNVETDQELDALAKMYGSAKAKSTASVFIKMDLAKSASILRRMTTMNASRVMTEIAKQSPDYASALTTYMVGDSVETTVNKVTAPLQ